jgi:hypothetical protein
MLNDTVLFSLPCLGEEVSSFIGSPEKYADHSDPTSSRIPSFFALCKMTRYQKDSLSLVGVL